MGVPGWPDLACWTASIERVRIVLIANSVIFSSVMDLSSGAVQSSRSCSTSAPPPQTQNAERRTAKVGYERKSSITRGLMFNVSFLFPLVLRPLDLREPTRCRAESFRLESFRRRQASVSAQRLYPFRSQSR